MDDCSKFYLNSILFRYIYMDQTDFISNASLIIIIGNAICYSNVINS